MNMTTAKAAPIFIPASVQLREAATRGWRVAMNVAFDIRRDMGIDLTTLIFAADRAYYGPIDLADSWRDSDGRPSSDALAKFPRIARCIRTNEETFWRHVRILERLERLGRTYYAEFGDTTKAMGATSKAWWADFDYVENCAAERMDAE